MISEQDLDSNAPDDPSAYEHAEWHALVGRVMVSYRARFNRTTKSYEDEDRTFFKVAEARVSLKKTFLRLRPWGPSSAQPTRDLWVGGEREGMFGMCLRPDGGFQVAGDKLTPVDCSEFGGVDDAIGFMSKRLSPIQLEELRAFLGLNA